MIELPDFVPLVPSLVYREITPNLCVFQVVRNSTDSGSAS